MTALFCFPVPVDAPTASFHRSDAIGPDEAPEALTGDRSSFSTKAALRRPTNRRFDYALATPLRLGRPLLQAGNLAVERVVVETVRDFTFYAAGGSGCAGNAGSASPREVGAKNIGARRHRSSDARWLPS